MKKAFAILLCMVMVILPGCMRFTSKALKELPAVSVGETSVSEALKITLEKAYCNKEIPSFSSTHYTAGNGKVYLVLIFDAENISDKTQIISLYESSAYADDYVVSKTALIDVYGESTFDGSIDAGRKRRGFVAFEINENWKRFEFSFADNTATYRFELTHEQTIAE